MDYIVCRAAMNLTHGDTNVFPTIDVTSLNSIKCGKNHSCSSHWIVELLRYGTMSSFALDLDIHNSRLGKKPTFTDSNIAFIEVWDIMETIYLVDVFHTALSNHMFGTAGIFFGRLEKKSDKLIFGNFVKIVHENLSSGQNCCHVSVMTTHVSPAILRTILQMRIILNNG